MKSIRGFSLLELIITLCIFAVLIFLSIPFLRSSTLIRFMDEQSTVHTSSESPEALAIPIIKNQDLDTNTSLSIPTD
jgi:prepilin-type N-terminal cleavage/methylation domain-containing protein